MKKIKGGIIFLIIAVIAAPAFVSSTFGAGPTFEEVKASYRTSDALLLDRHGQVIHELRVDARGRRLAWVALRDISPALVKAVIHSEDRRFYEHHGPDWLALGAAAVRNFLGGNRRGASTITMQLAAMLDKGLKPKAVKRRLYEKWKQVEAARKLESAWSKGQILEAYLNLLTFRGELQGVAAAGRGLFGREPSGLNTAESLLLAALIRSPNAPAEAVAARACRLAEALQTGTEGNNIKALARETLSGLYRTTYRAGLALHVARQLLGEGKQKMTSTLDGPLQRYAAEVLNYHLQSLRTQNVRDGAVLVIDNKTGEILAYLGNAGPSASARHVDGVLAKRQAGSTLKPFLYGLAMERRLLTAASVLDDSPLQIPTEVGLYSPHNYDDEFKGMVSVRTALASSLNIPAVRALLLTGTDDFVRRLEALGFQYLREGGYYGFSLALGSADVSLYELTNAYRSLANGGTWRSTALALGSRTKPGKQVLAPEAAYIVSSILADRAARGLTFGYENVLATRFWTAVKTGTSKDMRDNWCIGFSEKYTVGVWVGNFSGEPMWNVSGMSGAAPVWSEVMNYLHRRSSSKSPAPPAGVVARKVAFNGAREAARDEWFVLGTEPVVSPSPLPPDSHLPAQKPRIIYPPAKTIIALDPDIPAENSAVFFAAQGKGPFVWLLNNGIIGASASFVRWQPQYGKYHLSLADGQGRVIDAVDFEVRGAPAPLPGDYPNRSTLQRLPDQVRGTGGAGTLTAPTEPQQH